MAAIKVLDVARVGAVLTQMHAPRVIYVPVMVVVRFFPMAVRELRAIVQAMTLRGLNPGARSAVRHPIRTGEYVVIPFLASAAASSTSFPQPPSSKDSVHKNPDRTPSRVVFASATPSC